MPVTAAIADGRVTAADGAELVKLADHPEAAVKALADLGQSSWLTAAAAVNRQLQQVQRQEAAEATRAQFEAQGIPVVDPGVLGPYGYAKRLHDGTDLEPHRAAGCLVGAAASHNGGPELYCREPDTHEGTAAALPGWSGSFGPQRDERDRQAAEQARHRKAAAQSRRAVAAQLAARSLPGPVAADLIARTLIARHADAQALKTAMGWLRAAGIGPAEGDYYAFAEEVTTNGSDADVRRLAVAMALAVDERLADGGEFGNPEWGRRQVAYLDRLISEAGYEPGEWEQAQLDEARARVAARDELSCQACGCRFAKSCESVYPRCDVEQDRTGAWSYRCACKRQARAGGRTDRTLTTCTTRSRTSSSPSPRRPAPAPGYPRRCVRPSRTTSECSPSCTAPKPATSPQTVSWPPPARWPTPPGPTGMTGHPSSPRPSPGYQPGPPRGLPASTPGSNQPAPSPDNQEQVSHGS